MDIYIASEFSGELRVVGRYVLTGSRVQKMLMSGESLSISLEGPILAHDLRDIVIGARTSQLFCLTIFGIRQYPDVEACTVSMSAKPGATRPAPS